MNEIIREVTTRISAVEGVVVALAFGLVVAIYAASFYVVRIERRNWNNGFCGRCYTPWTSFDVDSQGGRGYKCSGCAATRMIWISYRKVDAERGVS